MSQNKAKKKIYLYVFFFFAVFSFWGKANASVIADQLTSSVTFTGADSPQNFINVCIPVSSTATLGYAQFILNGGSDEDVDSAITTFAWYPTSDCSGIATDEVAYPESYLFGNASSTAEYSPQTYDLTSLGLGLTGVGSIRFNISRTGGASCDAFSGSNCGSWGNISNVPFYIISDTESPPASLNTSIYSVSPYNLQIVSTSTSHTVQVTGRLSNSDLNDYSKLIIHIENSAKGFEQCADVICSQLDNNSVVLDFEYDLVTASPFNYSSTTQSLPIGKYYMKTSIVKGSTCLLGLCAFTTTIISTSTTFVVGTTTKIDDLKTDAIEYLNNLSNSGETFENCGISDFNLFLCGADLITWSFVPTPDAVSYITNQIYDMILVHFPIGYITDFVSIMSTSSVGTLQVFNATIPNGVVGAGSEISLDFTNALDYILYATSSYSEGQASTTETFFDFTNYYWKIFLYMGVFFYMLARIIKLRNHQKYDN